MKKILLPLLVILNVSLVLFTIACSKTNENVIPDQVNMEEFAEEYTGSFDEGILVGDRASEPGRDSCCRVTLASFLPNGTLYYTMRNPTAPTYLSQKMVRIIDADYGGILLSFPLGITGPSCHVYNFKIHLAQIVQIMLQDCTNRYQVRVDLQTKADPYAAWVTCSSSLSPVFELGSNGSCE